MDAVTNKDVTSEDITAPSDGLIINITPLSNKQTQTSEPDS